MNDFKLSPIFKPLIKSARYKSLRGGRGGAKSWAVASVLIEVSRRGTFRILCARELQNSISDSVISLLNDTISRCGYDAEFEVLKNRIINKNTGSEFLFYGIKNNTTKIKSINAIDICWVEEAENVSKESWDILIPSIRKEDSEIWLTWNPKNILDATYQYFVTNPPDDCIEIVVNYTDNKHLPDVLLKEAEECKRRDFDLYKHIWLGEPIEDSELSIIKPLWIEYAIDAHKKLDFDNAGETVIGFDVADDGEDANAIILRRGSIVHDMKEWNKQDVIFSTNFVNDIANSENVHRIIYDNIGVGAGVKAQFKRLNSKARAIPFNAGAKVVNPERTHTDGKKNKDMFKNIKAQMWWNVRQRFFNTYRAIKYGDKYDINELISIESEIKDLDYLKAELSRPRIAYDENGRVMVESKKDLKKRGIKSPNKADAFIMAFANVNQGLNINKDILR